MDLFQFDLILYLKAFRFKIRARFLGSSLIANLPSRFDHFILPPYSQCLILDLLNFLESFA